MGVTASLAENNGSVPPGLWLTSLAGWLPRTEISSGTLRSVIEYRLPFFFICQFVNGYCNSKAVSGIPWNLGMDIGRHGPQELFTFLEAIRKTFRIPVVRKCHHTGVIYFVNTDNSHDAPRWVIEPSRWLLLERGMLFRRLFVLRRRCCSSAATSRLHCFSHRTLHHSVQLCDRL